MPPVFSDDEISEVEETQQAIESRTKSKPKTPDIKGKGKAIEYNGVDDATDFEAIRGDYAEEVEDEEDEEELEEEELGDDEYIVEKILGHLINEDGELRFKVKWLGFDKKSDQTWEPEENLINTSILGEYYESVGGRAAVLSGEKPKKKRGRVSTSSVAAESSTNGKRRKTAPKSETPSASVTNEDFKPPSGSWEDAVQGIDACEGTGGTIHVYLHWATGNKTRHPLEQVYKRCPQKMLKFYEAHLSFTPATHATEAATNVVLESSKRGRGRPKKKQV